MSLLSPLFLLGLLGIALPIWLHRLQTHTTEREKFSSIMFLEPSEQRIHVRRQLKYLLLMALRILFLLLLIFAFARPVFFSDPDLAVTESSTHHVIVIDNSFSMHAGDNFDQALEHARTVIRGMAADDLVSIFTASDSLRQISPPGRDRALLENSLNSLRPDHGRLDIGAMIAALNNAIEASEARFILHFISDYQRSGQPLRFADMVPAVINGRALTLNTLRVDSDTGAGNWRIAAVTVPTAGTVQVALINHSPEAVTEERTVSLQVNDSPAISITESLTASENSPAYVSFGGIEFNSGDNRLDVRLSPADILAEDDIYHSVFDNSPPAPVLLLTADPGSLAGTYISAALETAPRGYRAETFVVNDLDPRILQRYPWLIIEDIGIVNASLQEALLAYLNNGGSILAAAGPRSQNLTSLPVGGHSLGGNLSLNLTLNVRQSIQQINSTHPALAGTPGWNSLNVNRVLPLGSDNNDNVLISLSSGVPLLLERQIGRGQFMFLNTSLDNTWSDLPVRPVFVSFMAEAARHLSGENILSRQQTINSVIQLGQAGGGSGQVFDPQGRSLLALSDTAQAQSVRLSQTGYYRLVTPGTDALIAVNPDPRESNLTPMTEESLQNWRNMVANSSGAARPGSLAVSRTERERDTFEIWQVLLALLAIIVILESVLGNRYLSFKTGVSEQGNN